MDHAKRERLEKAGYTVTSAEGWLGLSAAESTAVAIAVELGQMLKFVRERAGLTQVEAARKLGSSQSRVSKMEKADPSVSLDLLITSALALGATRADVAAAVAGAPEGAPPARAERAIPERAAPARRAATRAA